MFQRNHLQFPKGNDADQGLKRRGKDISESELRARISICLMESAKLSRSDL